MQKRRVGALRKIKGPTAQLQNSEERKLQKQVEDETWEFSGDSAKEKEKKGGKAERGQLE